MGRQKERSESSSGTLRRNQATSQAQLNQRVRDAAQRVEDESPLTLHKIPVAQIAKRAVAELSGVELPYVSGASTTRLSVTLSVEGFYSLHERIDGVRVLAVNDLIVRYLKRGFQLDR